MSIRDGLPTGHGINGLVGADPDGAAPGAGRGSVPGSVVQVLALDGGVAGAGFLVGEGLVVTCAHVVRAAGREPGGRVQLAFPHLPGAPRVWGGVPAEQWREPKAEDIAFVELESVPAGVRALALGSGAGCQGHGVSSFGFPAQAPPGGHFGWGTVGDLLPDSTGAGVLLQLSGANELTTGFSGGPVVDGVSGLVIGMVTSITSPDVHLRGLGIAYCTPAEVLREVRSGLPEHQVCPYRGLEPFTAKHTQWFHGRETAVENVLDALGGQRRALLLLGPSGAGKSSLIQAGVLPALADGELPGSDRWLPLITRPGRDLLTELEHAGLPKASSDGLLPAVQHRLADEPDHDRLLLVIDQFEELLTQPTPTEHGAPDRRATAVDELLTLINSPADASLILIMRDDFYPQLAALAPGLLKAAAPAPLNVPATLSTPELHAIIARPAQAVGLEIEDGLAERIITDIRATDPTHRAPVTLLPPLELALSQLWERRENGRLTHRAYQQIGEVTGSLATWCNKAISQLPTEHRPIAHRILTALVRPADQTHAIPATRQQITLTRLRALTTSPAAGLTPDALFEDVLAALTHYRIITTRTVTQPGNTTGEPTAELIHDALIRDWGALRDWVAQDHRFQVWLHRTTEQQTRHAQSDLPGDLLDGTVLAEGTDWASQRPLPPEISTYLTTSQQRQQGTLRRTRRIITALAGLLALALIAAGTAFWQRQTALNAQREAQSRQLAAQSTALIDSDPDLAALLAVRSHSLSPTNEAKSSLYAAAALPLRNRLISGKDPLHSVTFSPDGETLAVSGYDGTVRLWDPTVGGTSSKPRATLTGNGNGEAASVAFSPDGKTLAIKDGEGTVRLWDPTIHGTSSKPQTTLTSTGNGNTFSGHSMVFSPNGKTLATAGDDGTVRLWDPTIHGTSSKPQATLTSNGGRVDSVVFSPHGETLATAGGYDGTVRLWDPTVGGTSSKPRATLTGNGGQVDAVVFSPDGKTLTTTSANSIVRLWDSTVHGTSSEPRAKLTGNDILVTAVAFSPDGTTLATASYSGAVRLWDPTADGTSSKPRAKLTGNGDDNPLYPMAFSPDGDTLAVGGKGDTVRLWDPATNGTSSEPRATLTGYTDRVNSVAFSPDSETLATVGYTGAVRLWDPTADGISSKPRARLTGHTSPMNSGVYSPDGKTLAIGGRDGAVRLWDPTIHGTSSKPQATLTGNGDGSINPVAYSPDGKTLAIGGRDGTVRLWDPTIHGTSSKPRATLTGNGESGGGEVASVAFSFDGKALAIVGGDGVVRLWDPTVHGTSSKPRATLTGNGEGGGEVASVAFSPDGKTLATGTYGDTVRLWTLTTDGSFKPRAKLTGDTSGNLRGATDTVVFSPDGKTLAIGGGSHTVRLWTLTTDGSFKPRAKLTGNSTNVMVAFSHDGETLATGDEDGMVRLWDPTVDGTSSKPRVTLTGNGVVRMVSFSPNGKILAAGGDGTTVAYLWDLNLPDAAEASNRICQAIHRDFTSQERSIYLRGQTSEPVCPNAAGS
ncbi:nSTAND1 domain-containing NTPase [Streptomyces sp. TE33382]